MRDDRSTLRQTTRGRAVRVLVRARDALYRRAFQKLFVYNILFEDSEVDEWALGVDERSRVLAISGAGCGVAAMMARHPTSIDVVDLNPHHLALAALKIEAPRRLGRYSGFYDLLGRGWAADPRAALARITATLPDWIRAHWRAHWRLFSRGLYGSGLTAEMLAAFRRFAGVDETWLRWASTLDAAGRARAVRTTLGPILRSPLARAWLGSPGQLVALGINFEQRDRLLATENEPSMAEFILAHLERLAGTDVATNWFVWYAIAGQFDHDCEAAVPPYLRRDRFEPAREAATEVGYRRADILDVLARAPRRHYTHFALLDAPDWLDEPTQERLLEGILRAAADGARVVTRSVESGSMFERSRHARRFRRLDELSDRATGADRTRQYRRVDVHEVRV